MRTEASRKIFLKDMSMFGSDSSSSVSKGLFRWDRSESNFHTSRLLYAPSWMIKCFDNKLGEDHIRSVNEMYYVYVLPVFFIFFFEALFSCIFWFCSTCVSETSMERKSN